MLKILLLTVGLASAQYATYNIDDSTLWDINMLRVTYIEPAIHADKFTSHYERAALIKMNTLFDDIEGSKIPQWKANNIVNHAKKYVESNKEREEAMKKLSKSMEAYLND